MRSSANTTCCCLLIATLSSIIASAQTQLSDENAYNPVPSPDGRKIAAVRTGWQCPGGSGGLGRSNLVSDLIILDRDGHTLSPKPLADAFVAAWTKAGIVSFRDWSFELLSANGSLLRQGRVCPGRPVAAPPPGCAERVAYLASIHGFVSVFQKFGDSVLMSNRREFSTHHHEGVLGESLVPSPDERYIAAGPGHFGRTLSVYHVREKAWIDFGKIVIHPDPDWDLMEASWSPWFADGSQLAFFDAQNLIVSSPDGLRKRVILQTNEPAGLAVPSPDGQSIAYATFTATNLWSRKSTDLELHGNLGCRTECAKPAAPLGGTDFRFNSRFALAEQ